MPDQLKDKWGALWEMLGVTGNADAAFETLAQSYAVPPRAYHNLNHIADCLGQFELVSLIAKDPQAVELAIWFHDAIYNSKGKDNEEQSAVLAVKFIDGSQLPETLSANVSDLILATKHEAPPTTPDAALLVDIDLSILGRATEVFDTYERQIREEYAWVEARAFAVGRTAVLESFLSRPAIYNTGFFRRRYESRARENLRRSIEALKP